MIRKSVGKQYNLDTDRAYITHTTHAKFTVGLLVLVPLLVVRSSLVGSLVTATSTTLGSYTYKLQVITG